MQWTRSPCSEGPVHPHAHPAAAAAAAVVAAVVADMAAAAVEKPPSPVHAHYCLKHLLFLLAWALVQPSQHMLLPPLSATLAVHTAAVGLHCLAALGFAAACKAGAQTETIKSTCASRRSVKSMSITSKHNSKAWVLLVCAGCCPHTQMLHRCRRLQECKRCSHAHYAAADPVNI